MKGNPFIFSFTLKRMIKMEDDIWDPLEEVEYDVEESEMFE